MTRKYAEQKSYKKLNSVRIQIGFNVDLKKSPTIDKKGNYEYTYSIKDKSGHWHGGGSLDAKNLTGAIKKIKKIIINDVNIDD